MRRLVLFLTLTILFIPSITLAQQSTTSSVRNQISEINRAVKKSIKAVGGDRKSNSVRVMQIIASMEINRLYQIASISIYSEADKRLLISNIDRNANRAVRNITGTCVQCMATKADIEMTRTSLKTAIRNL